MQQEKMDELLQDLRNYATALRYEWERKNPQWIPSWVEKFQAIDDALSNGEPLPSDWNK